MRLSISQITTVTQPFADDLDAYREAGADGIGIWEMKLADDSLERFRASGLGAAAAVPAVPSILPLPLMEGPDDPAERVEAIRAGIARLAPFEPECVLFLTGPGEDREVVLDGIRSIADAGREHGVPVALEPIQREFAHFWSIVSSLDEAAALIDESGADVGLLYDSWHLWREPLEQVERHRDRIRGVHLADWREPTRNTNDRVLPGDGVRRVRPDPRRARLGRLLRPGDLLGRRARGIALARGAARAGAARARSPAEDGIDRICIVGAGVIGSLFAGHLGRVAEVSVLCRREEHAAALNEHGLRVSGRSDFVTPVRASTDPAELPEPELVIVATKTTELEAAAARLEGHWPGAAVMTVQNGLGAEEAFPGRRVLSAVTFMSGTRHEDTHVEYILDTETWLGPYGETPFALAEEVAATIVASGLKARAFEDLRPAQWSKLIFNATVNAVAALTGLPHDPHFAAREQPGDLGHLVYELVEEGKRVAAAAGVELHEDPWEMNVLATQRGSRHYPSMLEDVEAHRPTEIEHITGALVREAGRQGVPVPLHTTLYRLVRAREASWGSD